ncbi:MAG: AMP nucleosidase, partial [Croceibacterium sp.]
MDSATAIAELTAIYDAAVDRLRTDIAHYARNREIPPDERRRDGSYAYPELRVHFTYTGFTGDRTRAFGRLHLPGTYTTTVTHPELFANYLTEQLDLLLNDYHVDISVHRSRQEIPFPYVLDAERGAAMLGVTPTELARHFPTTELALIGDELADCINFGDAGQPMPLSLFDGLRTDFSLARLTHYSGTSPAHFQRFVLFTNYHRYIDEFVDWAGEQIGLGFYTALAGAGGLMLDA